MKTNRQYLILNLNSNRSRKWNEVLGVYFSFYMSMLYRCYHFFLNVTTSKKIYWRSSLFGLNSLWYIPIMSLWIIYARLWFGNISLLTVVYGCWRSRGLLRNLEDLTRGVERCLVPLTVLSAALIRDYEETSRN